MELQCGLPRRGVLTGQMHSLRPLRRSAAVAGVSRRHTARVQAELKTAKGTRFLPEQLTLKQNIGEGSFGEVFEGFLTSRNGDQRVILKRVKGKVEGAEHMHQMEHLLNVYASKAARNSVADFLGFCDVEDGPLASRNKLTRGLWLVWGYQGNKTLAYYLKRRDCLEALATDLGVPEEAAVPTVMRHIFQCLEEIHSAGVVHRDIKPANIIFCERDRRFKLIDLGAACDLRSGTNYRPTETILDPCYCPPEEYVLPTDAPHLSRQIAPVALAMSPLLWTQHRPDCFDTYSAGIVLMQLAVPSLRKVSELRNFRQSLARNNNELHEWRVRAMLPARLTVVLDANDGEGWDLAEGLLRPREVENDGNGNVKFVSRGGAPRLTASGAMRHPFVKRALAPGGAPLSPLASLFVSMTGSTASADGDDDLTPVSSASSSSSGRGKGSTQEAAPPSPRRSGGFFGWGAKKAGSGGSSSSGGSGGGSAGGEAKKAPAPSMWQSFVRSLYDLEARVRAETSATEVQTTLVQQLRAEVAAGKAKEETLIREESVLAGMQKGLQESMRELRGLYSAAANFLGGGSSSASKPAESSAEGASNAAASAASSSKEAGKEARSGSRGGSSKKAQAAAAAAAAAEEEAAAAAAAAKPAQQGGGWEKAAENALNAGMKLGGLAMHVASSLAESIKSDAERAQRDAAAQRAAILAYTEAVQQLRPAVGAQDSFEDVAARLPEGEAFAVLTEARRRTVFTAYVDNLKRAERASRQKAASDFQALLEEAGLGPAASWDEFAARHEADPRFVAVAEEEMRQVMFTTYVDQLRSMAEAEERAAEAERNFRVLMQEKEVLICSGASWAQVKPEIWADPRFDAVKENRRRALFGEFRQMLEDAGKLAPSAAAATAAAAQAPLAEPPVAGEEGDEGVELGQLRAEQARLKEEYDRLEAKLKEMEQQFKAGNGPAPAAGAVSQILVEDDGRGNKVFHFGEALPLPAVPGGREAEGVNGVPVSNNGAAK